ncbi:MAG: hypothetical protein KF745_04690 [Phycisphaeraceae bacterium]|nr:hypothetical protein [Phycisphaeraceae bacterium]
MSVATRGGGAFVIEARSVAQQVRRALAESLAAIGCDAAKPPGVSRQLGLDKTLAWKLCRIVTEEDPCGAIAMLPGRGGVKIVLESLRNAGAPDESVIAVQDALAGFDRMVEAHAGDRETLEMMLGVRNSRATAKRIEAFRKSGFQANSAIWGVQARVQVSLHVMAPSAGPGDAVSMATICGLADFRRLRPDVPWSAATLRRWGSIAPEQQSFGPIDPSVGLDESPLLAQYCSDPLPQLRQERERDGTVRFVLEEGPVGNTAAATVVFGWRHEAVASKYESHPGEFGEHVVTIVTPVESLVHDLLVHRSLDFAMNPTAHFYSQLPGGPRYPEHGLNAGLLPVPVEVTDLGSSPPDTTTTELPHYREMAEAATKSLGYSLDEFQGYRMRVKYPPMPTMAILRHSLLRKP